MDPSGSVPGVDDVDDVEAVDDLVRGAWVAMCVRAMAELGLADAAVAYSGSGESPDGAVPEAWLAERSGVPASRLRRLLVALADAGLVAPAGEHAWRLTPRGAVLRRDHPSRVRGRVMTRAWTPTMTGWTRLAEALRRGERTFGDGTHTFWEALSAAPAQQREFNALMALRGEAQAQSLLEVAVLDGVATLVDVGGGRGALLAALLRERPGLRGVLADRADVVSEVADTMTDKGVADRCRAVPTDFFTAVPSGGDAYVLANILHDWTDDECRRILGVVRAAMAPGARLLVLEHLLDADRDERGRSDLHLLDLHMLVLFGAAERTTGEYVAMLADAGFTSASHTSTSTGWDVVSAIRA